MCPSEHTSSKSMSLKSDPQEAALLQSMSFFRFWSRTSVSLLISNALVYVLSVPKLDLIH